MDFVRSKWSGLVKAYKHYVNPNDNPSEEDKKAFRLLDNAEIGLFIDFVESNPVNIHVRDFSTVNFLIKAQDVANDTNPVKKLLTQDERTARAIKATTYLIEKGIDIDYRDKSGGTALQAAVHWNNFEVAEVLLKRGADPNLGSEKSFLNIPLISATFKQNEKMIVMLISYGANVEEALALA
jgi:ankyrin repeat protein